MIILITRNLGIVPINFFTVNSGEIGSVLEILFLALALGDRYNLYKKERESTQKEMLALQKAANVTLEQKVQERTLQLQETNNKLNAKNDELLSLNEEINQQNDEILSQRDALSIAVHETNKQKENILASINYALKIQTAMLPFEERIAESLKNFFIFYKPRDIVSGDFYFFENKDTHVVFSALDCTGHGVPGAFMSMIGHEILGEIVNVKHIYSPDLILNNLHKGIYLALQQDKSENRDGMDVVMISLKKDLSETSNLIDDKNIWNNKFEYLEYAGAMNPFYYVQNNVLTEIKATKKAIGGSQEETLRSFNKHRIELANQKTVFWLTSDGYQDQFGGKDNRKFMVKPFRELLFSIHHLPMSEQKIALQTNFDVWKGNHQQVDDVLVIGVEI
jgi:serine phosphatase RsbU (regulator of sigma subunit)